MYLTCQKGMLSVTDIFFGSEISSRVQILAEAVYTSLCTNAFCACMNLHLLPQPISN